MRIENELKHEVGSGMRPMGFMGPRRGHDGWAGPLGASPGSQKMGLVIDPGENILGVAGKNKRLSRSIMVY